MPFMTGKGRDEPLGFLAKTYSANGKNRSHSRGRIYPPMVTEVFGTWYTENVCS